MSRYPEIDLRRVQGLPIAERESKVDGGMLASPPSAAGSFADFWDSLPAQLAGADLRRLANAIVAARKHGRPVVWMCGAHVIKAGLGPILIRLLREDFVTLLAVNGAFAIHDAELALWGHTSEDVEAELSRGRFGMARETAALLNGTAQEAARAAEGYGEALGKTLLRRRSDWALESVLGVAYELEVPATVHVAIGTDIVHQHGDFSGAAAGEATARDFRILAAHLQDLAGAVILNVGSSVILPEVFLKAFSVVTHLGARPEGLLTAALDFQRQYRPLTNVVSRPQRGGPGGISLVGPHEILLPMLWQGLMLERSRQVS